MLSMDEMHDCVTFCFVQPDSSANLPTPLTFRRNDENSNFTFYKNTRRETRTVLLSEFGSANRVLAATRSVIVRPSP